MRYTVVVGLAIIILSATTILSPDGYCDYTENDAPQLEFTFSDGQTTIFKLTDTNISTSTVVTEKGMTHDASVFGLQLDRMPTSITLHSNTGDFRVSITITSSDPGMVGMPMKLYYGQYVENLIPPAYSCKVPSSSSEWLSPNQKYQTSLYIDDGTGHYVPYDPPSGLKISMRWESSEDTRFVRFFSDGDVIGSRFYNPGEKLGDIPSAPERIVPFIGWYDSLGEKVNSDTVYDYEGDMDFHTVYDIDASTLIILILITLIVGLCAMLIVERMD